MSASNYQIGTCVEQDLIGAAAEQKTTVDAIRASKTPAFFAACGGTTSSAVAGTTGTTATGTSTAGTNSDPLLTASKGQNTAAQTVAQQQQAAQQAAQQQAQQPQQASGGGFNPAALAQPLMQMAQGNGGSGSSQGDSSNSDSSSGAPAPQSGPSLANLSFGDPSSAPAADAPIPPAAQQVITNTNPVTTATQAQQVSQQNADAAPVPKELVPAAKPVTEGNANALTQPPPQTAITAAANSNAQKVTSQLNQLTDVYNVLCTPPTGATSKYSVSMNEFKRFMDTSSSPVGTDGCANGGATPNAQANSNSTAQGSGQPANSNGPISIKEFNEAVKNQCTHDAEQAEKLCVESDSMKAARTMMDLAGPVLMGMNAAQKTCGGMADVTKFLGGALTVANGICMGVKMKCEKTCENLAKRLETSQQSFASRVKTALDSEHDIIHKECTLDPVTHQPKVMDPTVQACVAQNDMKRADADKALGMLKQLVANQHEPQMPGTVAQLDAKCKDKMRNIVGLASNIAAIGLAMNSAKKCEKDLAAAAAQGDKNAATVSTQEYCSAAETKDTQFCKCQGNSTAQGCGASLVSSTATDVPPEQRGVDLKNFGGASGFAGAGGSGGISGAYKGSYGAGNSADPVGQALLNGGALSSGGSGAGAGVASVGGATGGDAKGSETKPASGKSDDKKWSFGSFASSLGGALGFGNNAKNEANGSLNAAAKAAIQRKIASDRYAAEISPSTGADNFAKVKRSYVQKADTFMAAP
jgi:hypothetical protein